MVYTGVVCNRLLTGTLRSIRTPRKYVTKRVNQRRINRNARIERTIKKGNGIVRIISGTEYFTRIRDKATSDPTLKQQGFRPLRLESHRS